MNATDIGGVVLTTAQTWAAAALTVGFAVALIVVLGIIIGDGSDR